MGCGSCGTSKDGAPGGCQSHGSCSSGGCNRMNVHDWLANLPFSDPESNCRIVEISFNNGSRKDYFKNTTLHYYEKGEMVAVEGSGGFDVGMINLTGELVRLQLKKNNIDEKSPDLKKVLRRASEQDLLKLKESKGREAQMLIRSRAMARQLKLELKMAEVEIQADGRKATYFYIADDRVDFRELIKLYAGEFKVKVEMRQIGARQEAGKVGGIGSCGRELCCSTWLTDFKSVNTNAARYQNLSINQTKLSGQCGRLKCCLNYELDMYLDAFKAFPKSDVKLQTEKANAYHVKTDVFKRQMFYGYEGGVGGLIPLTPERVKEIIKMNSEGKKPKELNEYVMEVVVKEPDYDNVVGQDSLNRFEHAFKAKKKKKKPGNRPVDGQIREKQQNQNIPQAQVPRVEGEKPPVSANKRRNKRPNNRPKGNPNASNNEKKEE